MSVFNIETDGTLTAAAGTVSFLVLAGGGPTRGRKARSVVHSIPGGTVTYLDLMGAETPAGQFSVALASWDDYLALEAMAGGTATLDYLEGTDSIVVGDVARQRALPGGEQFASFDWLSVL